MDVEITDQKTDYDVVILGGGLAGLTLSLQLRMSRPEISILILEMRNHPATVAGHKVGESTVELGSHYLREVLNLKGYLEEFQLPKHGLRFFFKSRNKEDITTRVELGPRERLPVPSHQIDRGTFENFLSQKTQEQGTILTLGARVKDVTLSGDGHTVLYMNQGEEKTVKARWVADASSRGSILKKKLGFQKPMEHHVNAVWYRLKGVIDIDDWSDDVKWKSFLKPGLRYLSTVHFMDKGYWVWIIPLGSGNTSIGIVADPAVHSFDEINTYEKAMVWMEKNEPLCHKMLEPKTNDLIDFLFLKHYAHHTGRLYSDERWGVTGEAGAFLDPFYSPGTDFIAMNNTWLSDLILRDLNGDDITVRASIYEQSHLSLIDKWIPVYQNKYLLMGNTQIMVVKIFWDWATYWSVPALLFTNRAFTDIKMLKELFSTPTSLGRKFGELNGQMQKLFLDWAPYDKEIFSDRYIDPFDLKLLREFQQGIDAQYEPGKLIEKIAINMDALQKLAAEIIRHVSGHVHDSPMDMKVDPYTFNLDMENKNLNPADDTNAIGVDEDIKKDVEVMWFYTKKEFA
ncbi:MAG TPA: lycopene cyclase family protein [Chryseolinea sp.]|nr:lycopene cyclase family protein [Chryseolinea sp.]HPH45771.1 lycopene cyclase family protein [Chryseolinea sp.]HPM30148.1 lycopene cyclase family protein [Chryseolinea sp.]